MTLNELRYVVAVARERHFGRAAESCFVSQPTLSVGVRKLEDELGVSLFERGSGEVRVTAIGQRIVEQAQRVLEQAQGILRLARHDDDPLDGHLRVGALPTVGPYVMPRLVPEVLGRAPKMPLLLEEHVKPVLGERLKHSDLDAILISLPFDEPGARVQPLYEEPLVALMSAGHRLARKDAVSFADLHDETVLVLGPEHCLRDHVLEACPQCVRTDASSTALRRILDGGSLETIRCMVAGGVGVTLVPCSAADSAGFDDGVICARPFTGPKGPMRQIALAWRKSFPRVEAIDTLIEGLRGVMHPCQRWLGADGTTQD